MKKIFRIGIIVQLAIEWILDRFWSFFIKKSMGKCGKNVMIKPMTSIFKGIENIYISDDVRIARYATIYTTKARVYIGSKTDIAPYLKIISGNHQTNDIGHFMFDNDVPKRPEYDQDITIEGDSWFGINVTILSGVTIGRGSIIAAGAVVTHSCPPYSIIGGIPAKILKYRFTIDEVIEHEKHLYKEEKRYSKEYLQQSRLQNEK